MLRSDERLLFSQDFESCKLLMLVVTIIYYIEPVPINSLNCSRISISTNSNRIIAPLIPQKKPVMSGSTNETVIDEVIRCISFLVKKNNKIFIQNHIS